MPTAQPPETVNGDIHNLGEVARIKYEDHGDADGHDEIFDSMSMGVLPDLDDMDPHPVAPAHAAPQAHAGEAAMAITAADMVVAGMPNLAAHEVVAVKEAREASRAGAGGAYASAEAAEEALAMPLAQERALHQHQQHQHQQQHQAQQQQQIPQILPMAMMIRPMPEVVLPAKWLKRFEELKHYKQMHGHFNVPINYEKYKQLSAWARTQKQQFKLLKEGKPNHMSQSRLDLLNSVGFEWAGIKRDKFWHDRYGELTAFQAKFGNTRIPEKYDAAPQLHTWVSLQRRQLKKCKEGKPVKLTAERIRLLEALGLECGIRASTTWMDRFMELKKYKDEFGDCEVPQKYKVNVSLGRWVDNQKTQHQKLYDGKPTHITIERIQLLVSIGFNFRKKT